jgi:hypothetical protein
MNVEDAMDDEDAIPTSVLNEVEKKAEIDPGTHYAVGPKP